MPGVLLGCQPSYGGRQPTGGQVLLAVFTLAFLLVLLGAVALGFFYAVEAAGFEFVGESKLLANPADDRTRAVFDKSIRGRTDQFIYKFRKP